MHLELNLPAIIKRSTTRTTFLRRAYATVITPNTTAIHHYISSFIYIHLSIIPIVWHGIIFVTICNYFDRFTRWDLYYFHFHKLRCTLHQAIIILSRFITAAARPLPINKASKTDINANDSSPVSFWCFGIYSTCYVQYIWHRYTFLTTQRLLTHTKISYILTEKFVESRVHFSDNPTPNAYKNLLDTHRKVCARAAIIGASRYCCSAFSTPNTKYYQNNNNLPYSINQQP